METFSALLDICAEKSPVTGEFPTQRPVTQGFDVFFDLSLNKRLSKQWWGWWFETPPWTLWSHCNGHWPYVSAWVYWYLCMVIVSNSCLCDVFAHLQYIPRNMHTVFALLCFVVVIHWLIFPYPSGLLHWHYGNLTIAPVPAKQPWWIWINTSCEFIMNDCITPTKQSTTKPCAYFLGYTVWLFSWPLTWGRVITSHIIISMYTLLSKTQT